MLLFLSALDFCPFFRGSVFRLFVLFIIGSLTDSGSFSFFALTDEFSFFHNSDALVHFRIEIFNNVVEQVLNALSKLDPVGMLRINSIDPSDCRIKGLVQKFLPNLDVFLIEIRAHFLRVELQLI